MPDVSGSQITVEASDKLPQKARLRFLWLHVRLNIVEIALSRHDPELRLNSLMHTDDTIFAPATADAPAARAVVRVSGPIAFDVAAGVSPRWCPVAGSAAAVELTFAGLSCPGWIYCFRAPRSYTGDDTVEFHLPGNPVLVRLLTRHLAEAGCRPAGPGEFTARAYFAGKMNLSEAEGVAAAIAAASQAELSAARRLMSGELSRRLKPMMDLLVNTLALVEAEIDFSDQDVTFLAASEVAGRVSDIDRALAELLSEAGRTEPAGYPPTIVLVGRPNAGKSSLINALTGRPRAVVSAAAGTTRDVLSADLAVARGIVTLLDVAGLDQAAGDDVVDRQMQAAANRAIETADRAVLVIDPGDDRPAPVIDRPADLVVRTKVDLHPGATGVSVFTGHGLAELRADLDRIAFDPPAAPTVVLNHRHRSAIADARAALARADPSAAELVATDLRDALDAVGAVLGAVTPDDVLGRVFSRFCIGK
jgi:tRNA modification GTPase